METHPTIQPDLLIGGTRITEPTVALTAVLIALVCAWAWWQLRRLRPHPTLYVHLMQQFFLFMGLSSLCGGLIGHAFLHAVPFFWKLPGWLLGMVATALLAQAAIADVRPALRGAWPKALTVLNQAGFVVAAGMVCWKMFFPFVEAHAAFCLLGLVLPLQVLGLRRCSGNPERKRLTLWGIGMAALAVMPHVMKFSVSTWFTYFDLGHVLMCVSIWFFWKAAASPDVSATAGV